MDPVNRHPQAHPQAPVSSMTKGSESIQRLASKAFTMSVLPNAKSLSEHTYHIPKDSEKTFSEWF